MEEVSQDQNAIDQSGKETLQRDVSVGRWEAEIGMAEITVKKGKLWGSLGVIRNSKLYCHVEEAVYMVEQGSLLLLRDNGAVISLQEAYDLLVVPSTGCSWDAYQIFCHLKRLGYIVGRHDTPWSTSRAKRPPGGALPGTESETDLERKEEIPAAGNLRPKLGVMGASDDTNGQGNLATVLEGVQTDAVDSEDTDEESLNHDSHEKQDDVIFSSRNEGLCVDENGKGFSFLFSNVQLLEEGGDIDGGVEDGPGRLKLFFDVHHPNGRFKKTAPGSPAFSLCVVTGQGPPQQRQVRELKARICGRPIKFGTVDCGHVSIFSFTSCILPTLP